MTRLRHNRNRDFDEIRKIPISRADKKRHLSNSVEPSSESTSQQATSESNGSKDKGKTEEWFQPKEHWWEVSDSETEEIPCKEVLPGPPRSLATVDKYKY